VPPLRQTTNQAMPIAEVCKQINWTKVEMTAKIAYDNTYMHNGRQTWSISVTPAQQPNISFNVSLTLNVPSLCDE